MAKRRIGMCDAQVHLAFENEFDGSAGSAHIGVVKVLFFAQSRQATGCGEACFQVEQPISTSELWDRLIGRFSDLAPLRRTTRLARHESYLAPDEWLQPHDEIAVIPPVSGG